MSECIYNFFIINNSGGWEEINLNFENFNDDEPINVFCGNLDPTQESSAETLSEYFIVQTVKGHAFLFNYSGNSDVKPPVKLCEDLFIDNVYFLYDNIFITSDKELRIFSFNGENSELMLVNTINLPSPVLSMKSSSADASFLFILFKDFSLKMLRKQNQDLFIDIDTNILLFDVCLDCLVYIKNDLTKTTVRFDNGVQKEFSNEQLQRIPINIYLQQTESSLRFKCICEFKYGEIEINDEKLQFSRLLLKNDKIIYCDENCGNISIFKEDSIFETNDHIILFNQFNISKDIIVVIRPTDFGLSPMIVNQSTIEILDCQLNAINIQTGEMDLKSPLVNFYDSNVFLNLVLYILQPDENIFTERTEENFEERAGKVFMERSESFIQILNFIIDNHSTQINALLLSRILSYKFFDISLKSFKSDEDLKISPFSISCLSILLEKSIQISMCKLDSKMLFILRTDPSKDFLKFSIVPPVFSQFNDVHELSMSIIESIPQELAKKTLNSLLSCLKYTKCDIIQFADQCFKMDIIEDLNENVLFLIKKLLILGSKIENEKLPYIVRLLLYSYHFLSSYDSNNVLLNKIRDFFEHKPQDLDRNTKIKIEEEFNNYILDLKTKFQEFLCQVRFYPKKDIAPEIQKFIKCHIPISICDIESKFRDDIEKLSKSGKLLRLKIEFINLIQNADDYIASCQSSHFSRKRGDF